MKPAALLSLSAILLTGCATSGAFTSGGTTSTPVTTSSTKAPIHGLVAMNQESFNANPALTPDNSLSEANANPNVYVASVILVTWKQLQPTSATSFDSSAIDSGLSAIATYNAAHPTHLLVGKLRVFAGINTPTWAQNLDGAPLTIPTSTASLPRYWTPNYIAASKNLQVLLAAKYDTNALLGEVAVSGCSSSTAEPFVSDLNATTIPILKAAGYTDAQKKTCLTTMADQYSAWTRTPLDYTFNGFTSVDTGVQVVDSSVFPQQVMAAWRTQLGTARGVLANHGLQPTLTTSAMLLYPEFTTARSAARVPKLRPHRRLERHHRARPDLPPHRNRNLADHPGRRKCRHHARPAAAMGQRNLAHRL